MKIKRDVRESAEHEAALHIQAICLGVAAKIRLPFHVPARELQSAIRGMNTVRHAPQP